MSLFDKTRTVTGRISRTGYFQIYEWVKTNLDRIAQLEFEVVLAACINETQILNLNAQTFKEIVRDMKLDPERPWKKSPSKSAGRGGHSAARTNVSRFLARQLLYVGEELLALKRELNHPINPKNKIRLDILQKYANREINGEEANVASGGA